jgi:hypothetical protein
MLHQTTSYNDQHPWPLIEALATETKVFFTSASIQAGTCVAHAQGEE